MKTSNNTTMGTNTNVIMVQEWNDRQFTNMKKAIVKHFKSKTVETRHNDRINMTTWKGIETILGMPYTSSSMFACFNVTNTEIYFDADRRYKYEFFTIGVDGRYYAILWDSEENELCIEL